MGKKRVSHFKKIARDQLDIHSRLGREDMPLLRALEEATKKAGPRGHLGKFPTIDPVLNIGELWADRDALRAGLVGDTVPTPGTEYVLVFVPADGKLIRDRWYVSPAATHGSTPVRALVIGLNADDYSLLKREGKEALLLATHARLRAAGAIENADDSDGGEVA